LMEAAPSWLLVPLSWVVAGLSLWWRAIFPWLIMPLAVILYHRFHSPSRVERMSK
jgi:hypothetical protein